MLRRRRRPKTVGSILSEDLAYRPPLFTPEFPLVLLWSEKAACTTVVKWFFAQTGLLKRALNHHRWVHEYENAVFKARDGYLDDCAEALNSGVKGIKFVRNPYSRLYSGYLETCSPRVLSQPEHWSTVTRAKILRQLVGADAGLQYAYSFHQFVDWLADQAAEDVDPHLAPQSQPFESRLAHRIIRLEDSENVFLELEKDYSLTSTEGRLQIYDSGHHHDKATLTGGDHASILDVALPVVRTAGFELYDASVETIAASRSGEKIRELFKSDFDVLGYSPSPHLAER